MLFLWLNLALAADKSAQCVEGETTVVFEDAAFSEKKGSHGTVQPAGLAADLGQGLRGELRYEHAYGATFVVLELRQGDAVVAQATSWLSVPFDHGTNGSAEAKPGELPLGAISLTATVGKRTLACHGNFL